MDRDIDEAIDDFIQRIECYKASYMPIDDDKDRYRAEYDSVCMTAKASDRANCNMSFP